MSTPDSGKAAPLPEPGSVLPELGADFEGEMASVNGCMLHYVCGGRGPDLVLLHGFPQVPHRRRSRRRMPRSRHRVMPRTAASIDPLRRHLT